MSLESIDENELDTEKCKILLKELIFMIKKQDGFSWMLIHGF